VPHAALKYSEQKRGAVCSAVIQAFSSMLPTLPTTIKLSMMHSIPLSTSDFRVTFSLCLVRCAPFIHMLFTAHPSFICSAGSDLRLPHVAEALESPLQHYRLPCDLLINVSSPTIDPGLFVALDQAGMVFDGRLVVDAAFRTVDTNMYAIM
jgi:hypothetical protein